MLLCSCKRFFASLDRSVRLEMLLCSWKRFNASFDESVRLEMLLSSLKQFYASLDKSVRQEMLLYNWKKGFMRVWMSLCYREWFSVNNCWQELLALGCLNLPAKIRTGMFRALLYSDSWWLITQPRPIWKKAPLGLQRPCPMSCTIPHFLYWPPLVVPLIGPGLKGLQGQIKPDHPIIS